MLKASAKKKAAAKSFKAKAKAIPKYKPQENISEDKKTANDDKPVPKPSAPKKINTNCTKCTAIRSIDQPQLRCLLNAKPGEKYCVLHLSQKNITDYNFVEDEILDRDEKMSIREDKITVINPVIRKIIVDDAKPAAKPVAKAQVTSDKILYEQKASTLENYHKENEDDLEVKLLILANDQEYEDKIGKLIGPVFEDITLSEDQQDPVTFDPIWEIDSQGKKIPASVNKYYLFSYRDSKNKIRCLTIFTLYNMVRNNNFMHPSSMEEMGTADIDRARELIDLYSTKLNLFKEQDTANLTPEFRIKSRITKLFKQFHIHSIYFEEKWLTDITDISKLYKIISETEKLVSNNLKTINPNLTNFKSFQKKPVKKMVYKSSKLKTNQNNDASESAISLQEYIVDEWEKLIQAADTPQNQIPIWIIASGLSFVVNEVKQKYPDLEIMI